MSQLRRGSKTTQIAARMNNEGAILANEFSASRVKVLHANISRCGISNVALTHFDGRVFGAAVPEMFDAILLDAPCSGEGVVRKDPDALKKLVTRKQSGNRSYTTGAYRQRLSCITSLVVRWFTRPVP